MKRILLIEDDQDLGLNIQTLLEIHGYEVHYIFDPRECFAAIDTYLPEMIISDVSMPHLDGFELYEILRKKEAYADIPFLFLTARASAKDFKKGMLLGADNYISKPFEIDDLLAAIQLIADKKESKEREIKKTSSAIIQKERKVKYHEIGTPVHECIANLELLYKYYDELDEQERKLIVKNSLESALKLTRRIEYLKFYNQLPTKAEHAEEIEDLAQLFLDLVEKLDCKKHIDLICQMPSFTFNKRHLGFILSELLSNALNYKSENSIISILLGHDHIEMVNEQTYIKTAQTLSIEPFFQVDRKTFEQQGLGLGLYLVKKLSLLYGYQFSCFIDEQLLFHVRLSKTD
jgi:DNA-binding response OmpR family regulator